MTAERVVALDRAAARAAQWTEAGENVVLAIGSFDLLEAAHAGSLAVARARGDRMIVLVRDDASAALRLGAGRPVIEALERARLVAALRGVDLVAVTSDEGARGLARAIRSARASRSAQASGTASGGRPGSYDDPAETDPASTSGGGAGEGGPQTLDLVARVRARRGGGG